MTREIEAMNKQYGARRTRLKEHLLPPLKKEKKTQSNRQTMKTVTEALHKTSKIKLRN